MLGFAKILCESARHFSDLKLLCGVAICKLFKSKHMRE